MPYDPSRDANFASDAGLDDPASNIRLITPADEDIGPLYPKALRVYVPIGTPVATVRVLPKRALDGETVDLKFPEGVWVEAAGVRQVLETGTTDGLEIHGYF